MMLIAQGELNVLANIVQLNDQIIHSDSDFHPNIYMKNTQKIHTQSSSGFQKCDTVGFCVHILRKEDACWVFSLSL